MSTILKSNLSSTLEDRLMNVLNKFEYEKNIETNLDKKIAKTNKHFMAGSIGTAILAGGGFVAFAASLHLMPDGPEKIANAWNFISAGTIGGSVALAYTGIAGLASKFYQSARDKFVFKSDSDIAHEADNKLKSRISKIQDSLGVEFSKEDLNSIRYMKNEDSKNDIVKDIISRTKLKS